MIKAVIFDMDGVIVDSEPWSDKYYAEFIRGLGVEPPDLSRYRGMNSRDFWLAMQRDTPLRGDIDQFIIEGRKGYLQFIHSLPEIVPTAGVERLLEELALSDLTVALASSSNPERIDHILDRTGLKKFFKTIIHGDHVKHAKPAPDIFLFAAKQIDLLPKECIVIEDSLNGVKAAKAAGMKCVGYIGLPHNVQDLSAADVVVQDFSAVSVPMLLEMK